MSEEAKEIARRQRAATPDRHIVTKIIYFLIFLVIAGDPIGICATSAILSAPPSPTEAPPTAGACDPSYPDQCLNSEASDYDCAGGEGDGPEYVTGPVEVTGSDPFDLDRDRNGLGCEGW